MDLGDSNFEAREEIEDEEVWVAREARCKGVDGTGARDDGGVFVPWLEAEDDATEGLAFVKRGCGRRTTFVGVDSGEEASDEGVFRPVAAVVLDDEPQTDAFERGVLIVDVSIAVSENGGGA